MKRILICTLMAMMLLLTVFALSMPAAAADTKDIAAGQKYAVTYDDLYKGKEVTWSWSVDEFDLDFWIEKPDTSKHYQSSKASDSGTLTVPETGKWQFCWENPHTATASEDYTIKLTYDITMTNQDPAATIDASLTTATVGQSITFTASAVDYDGEVAAYLWDFKDGSTASTASVDHTFSKVGTYTVALKVIDNEGGYVTETIDIIIKEVPNVAPTASITADKITGTFPLEVSFTGTGTDTDGTIASYAWDFGDTGTSDLKDPKHTFTTAATFSVELVVTDNDGATGKATIDITVAEPANIPPTVAIAADKDTGYAPLTVTFTPTAADSDGTIASYSWDFGDGKTSTDMSPSNEYTTDGTYTVSLVVMDDDGASAVATIDIVVKTVPTDTDQDTDNDGLPDVWEIENGLDPDDATDAFADDDGDGHTNKEEFAGGSDPQSSTSVPKKTSAGSSPLFFLLILVVVLVFVAGVIAAVFVVMKKSATPPQDEDVEEVEEVEPEPLDDEEAYGPQ